MLTINHDPMGRGYKIKSVPKCLLITVETAREVGMVSQHYFMGHGSTDVPDCPVCKQLAAEHKAKATAGV